jgi:hypothetical protein
VGCATFRFYEEHVIVSMWITSWWRVTQQLKSGRLAGRPDPAQLWAGVIWQESSALLRRKPFTPVRSAPATI